MAESGATKACRLCLIMDSGLILIDMQLENSMRNILGPNITYESGLPKYSCNDCAELLRRFKDFKEKCLIAQTVLYRILKTNGQVTDAEIRKLNRKRLKLDDKITIQQDEPKIELTRKKPKEITPTEELLEEVQIGDVQSESRNVKIEFEMLGAMEESEDDDMSYEIFEPIEESEDLLEVRNPLLEDNVSIKNGIKEELTLSPELADISEGFNILCLPLGASCGSLEVPNGEENNSHGTQHMTYNCRRCSFSATDVETARNHRQQEHSDKKYICSYCNHRTANPSEFLTHMGDCHPFQIVCRACGASFDSRPGLRSHTRIVHKRSPRNKSESSSMKPKKKLRKKDKVKSKREVRADPKLLCTKCGIQFSTSAAWQRHLDDDHVVYEKKTPKKRKYHSMETLQRAVTAVKNNEMPLRQASRLFKIPRSTLQGKVKTGSFHSRPGPPPVFNEEEEGILVDFVLNGGSLKAKAVIAEAAILTKRLKREKFFKNGIPGPRWYMNFLKRHPELKEYANKV